MTKSYLKYRGRIKLLAFSIILSWLFICFRLFHVQVISGQYYQQKVKKQAQRKEYLPAIRGNIFDRNNKSLSRNIIHYTLSVNPRDVKNRIELADAISKITGKSREGYLKKIDSKSKFEYLERNLQRDELGALHTASFKGLNIERKYRRYYPHNHIAAQLVGYTDLDDEGISGIEKDYNSYLKGSEGWVYKTKGWSGKVQRKNGLPFKSPIAGNNIQLTIDLEYQSILEQELQKRQKETDALSATGIIMDPETGHILAIASTPGFNNNNFDKGPQELHRIKSITDQFEPGSTYKIVSVISALNTNRVNLRSEFNCENGTYEYHSIKIEDHGKDNGYGMLTLPQIIQFSSNIGIVKMIEKIRPKTLYATARDFGFGSKTGITLNGEVPGKLRPYNNWSSISPGQIAMGHEVGVTALQLATAYCAIANGGYLLKPRIINQIVDNDNRVIYKEEPLVVRKISDKRIINSLKKMLRGVIVEGTGRKADIAGWKVAGKTGTAQKWKEGKYSDNQFISNFVGFFPYEKPQLLGLIIIDEPKQPYHWGSEGAAVTFNRVMQRIISMDDNIKPPLRFYSENSKENYINLAGLPNIPNNPPSNIAMASNYKNEIRVPKILGLNIRTAVIILENLGLKCKLDGYGEIVWQEPVAGSLVSKGTTCIVGLK